MHKEWCLFILIESATDWRPRDRACMLKGLHIYMYIYISRDSRAYMRCLRDVSAWPQRRIPAAYNTYMREKSSWTGVRCSLWSAMGIKVRLGEYRDVVIIIQGRDGRTDWEIGRRIKRAIRPLDDDLSWLDWLRAKNTDLKPRCWCHNASTARSFFLTPLGFLSQVRRDLTIHKKSSIVRVMFSINRNQCGCY